MQYNLYFEYSSLIFVLPFFIITIVKKGLPGSQNLFFRLLTYLVTCNIVFSIAGVISLDYYSAFPLWTQYLINEFFLLSQALTSFFLFLYMFSLMGKLSTVLLRTLILCLIPLFATSALIITTFATKLIFLIEPYGVYIHGKLHFAVYINALFYMSLSLLLLIFKSKLTDKSAWIISSVFLVLLTVALTAQVLIPELLVINAAAVLGIILVYIFLQSPSHYVDKSTGLYNHNALFPIISSYFEKKRGFSLIIVYIEEYKDIGKLFGTKSSSKLIGKMKEYLVQVYGKDNVLKLNQDQFGIFYFQPQSCEASLKEFINEIPQFWSVGEADIKTSYSAVCLNSKDYLFPEVFLSNTDYAMNHSRQLNGGVYVLDKKANEQIRYRFKVEALLKKAIDTGCLEVYYQPIFNIKLNKFTSLEALARLYDDELGFVPPSVFIPIAEQNGMISKLGEVVLEKVCMLLKLNDLKRYGIEKIDVNLSVAQCMQSNLYSKITNIINKYGIDSKMLCFEVTETAATTSFINLKNNMEEIAKQGIKFALDDYGMGYSSINYLMKLPFSYLKTDRELLWSATVNKRNETLFECIVYMSRKLDLTIICEGAETEEHLNFLKSKGISLVQGFYYARPIKADEMLNFIKTKNKIK